MFNLPFLTKRKNKIKPTVLVILDGFGLAPASKGNAITMANTPNYDKYLKIYPNGSLIASGESVGLPANEVGNTEVGHLSLGAGRVVLQDLKRIDAAIERGRFYNNKAFLAAAAHVKNNNSNLHIMGLVGSGRVHSSIDHLYALLQLCKKEEVGHVFLHLFTDGRDSPPQEGIEVIKRMDSHLRDISLGRIVSISGRYYAMDRDRRWDRTAKTYQVMVLGEGAQALTAIEAVQKAYTSGRTDEFIEPTLIADRNKQFTVIKDNDAVIFFNYRVDRPKQLTMAFVMPDFENLKSFDFGHDPKTEKRVGEVKLGTTFSRQKVLENIFFVTMTEYQKNLPVSAVAFGPTKIENSLAVVLSNQGLTQMHMSESEKERFVTYYFDGQREGLLKGEDKLIVQSPNVETYDKKPEMALPQLVSAFIKQLGKDKYHFFIINFANPDMVAHSGNIQATVRAVEYTDKYLGKLVDALLAADGCAFITADHGNAEELLTFPIATYFYTTVRGSVNTDHSANPVPLIVVKNSFKDHPVQLPQGALSDMAPTILAFMGLSMPPEMNGKNLLETIYSAPGSDSRFDQKENIVGNKMK